MKIRVLNDELIQNQSTDFVIGGLDYILKLFQDNKCFYCGVEFVEGMNHHHASSWDHFLPKSKGYNFSGNLVIACRKCNSAKRSDIPSAKRIRRFVKLYQDAGLISRITIIDDDGSNTVKIKRKNSPHNHDVDDGEDDD